MAEALRAEWYGLDENVTPDFLSWLHEIHLPRLRNLPGVCWVGHYRTAAKPTPSASGPTPTLRETSDDLPPGHQFVLLKCADDDFLLTPDQALTSLDCEPRLARRHNWREAVFIEEARVDGPDAKATVFSRRA